MRAVTAATKPSAEPTEHRTAWQRRSRSRFDMDMGPAKGTEPKGAAPITRTTTKACATVRAFCPSCQTVTVSALSPLPPMAVACLVGLFSWPV